MSRRARVAITAATFLAVTLPAIAARAQCCQGYSPATVCAGVTVTKSRWCIQDSVPTGQNALPKDFCSYGDKVVTTLETTFNIKAPDIFEFELDSETGGAHTGTGCDHFGDGVAYDAFVGKAYGATSFWGYLLAMHEAINDWTGLASSGWPTDWWADHQSAFPNLMDFHIMNTVGVANNDMNLITAAAAQKKRFYPGGDSEDAKVVALDNVYGAMPNGDGFAGFSHMFSLQSGDGVKWDSLGVKNPDVKRSEYVAAYMSLALGKSALTLLQGPGTNGGGNICNNTPDGTPGDMPYTCNQQHIDQIATAHCSIAANNKPAADLTSLKAGKYDAIPSGPCGAACPSECACDDAQHCVAPWLGKPVGGGGTGSGGGGSGAGAANGGSAPTTGGASNTSGAPTGSGGAFSTSGAPGSAGVTSASAGTANGLTDPGADAGGCGCRIASGGERGALAAALVGALAGAGAVLRRRRRRAAR